MTLEQIVKELELAKEVFNNLIIEAWSKFEKLYTPESRQFVINEFETYLKGRIPEDDCKNLLAYFDARYSKDLELSWSIVEEDFNSVTL